ncbi:MAG: choice-of-anchor Q domain-containing protein [bacterium]|nr:choice-of-anchor Q domain-containing protein [bacterium]
MTGHGDTVTAARGVYLENIRFNGKNIVLTSTDPTNPDVVANTVIDGNQAGSVVTFDGWEDASCILSGFTIRNGAAYLGGGIFGGTYPDYTHATIQNNTITGNTAEVGGGLCGCNGTIQNNTITGNSAQSSGGGLSYCWDNIIWNNTITNNSAHSSGGGVNECRRTTIRGNTISGNSAVEFVGGGLYNCDGTIENNIISGNLCGAGWTTATGGAGLSTCRGIIQNNTISGNKAAGDGGGVGNCWGTVQNNVISGNSAERDGGGISRCHGTIQNDLIIGNSAEHGGGGLYDCHGDIQNNTIAANSAGTGGGLYECPGAIRNCIIWGNTGGKYPQLYKCNEPSYSCIQGWTGGGEANIADDPQFVNAAGRDYHLRPESPCTDEGINYYWFAWPQRDPDGNCRLVGERVDMGCYEYGSSPDSDGDLLSDDDEDALEADADLEDSDYDGLRDGLEILRGADLLDWWDPPPTVVRVPSDTPVIQKPLCLAVDGDEIIVEPGTYRENIVFGGADVVLRSSDLENREVVGSTIIDGGSRGSVISLTGTETEECVIAGLTILNGRAGAGGGICGGYYGNPAYMYPRPTHAAIRNNLIKGNSAAWQGGGLAFCDGTIRGNLITGNVAQSGAGLHKCNGTLDNNTVCANRATLVGGGMNTCDGTILNCIVWGNTAPGDPEISSSSAPGYSRVGGADPGFVDPDGPDNDPETYEDNDYRLADESPCIDAGWNEFWMSDAVDLDGNQRIIDGDGDGADIVDMGAYEYKFVLRVVSLTAVPTEFCLTWNSRPGHTYIVSVCPDLATWQWIGVATVPSQGFTTSWADSGLPANRRMFYRIDLD